MARISEVELDHAFAETALGSAELRHLLLSGGRFSRFAGSAQLLSEEQAASRKAKHWWKHWWSRLPDGSESETDIFLVFVCDGVRFALHVENKPADGKLTLRQAADYRRRAAFCANKDRWLNYADFETILLAPSAFAIANPDAASQFDRTLSYETLGNFIPLFRAAVG